MTTIIVPSNIVNQVRDRLRRLDAKVLEVKFKRFPNNEVLARISEVDKLDDKLILYFPLYPEVNDNIILLMQTLDIINYYKPDASLMIILPYLSYSRQDKRFLIGESLSLKVFLNMLSLYNLSYLVIYDSHNIQSLIELSKLPFIHLSLTYNILKEAMSVVGLSGENILLVSPDKGREYVVKTLSKRIGCDYTVVNKYRDRETGEVSFSFEGSLDSADNYKTAFIVDDEISTGGTMAGVAAFLRNYGIEEIYALATHLLMVNEAEKRLMESGVKRIFGSDTIPSKYSIYSIFDTFDFLVEFL